MAPLSVLVVLLVVEESFSEQGAERGTEGYCTREYNGSSGL